MLDIVQFTAPLSATIFTGAVKCCKWDSLGAPHGRAAGCRDSADLAFDDLPTEVNPVTDPASLGFPRFSPLAMLRIPARTHVSSCTCRPCLWFADILNYK